MDALRRYVRHQVPPPGPFRVMALGALITTAGQGAWYTSWALYFTTIARLPAATVGIGLAVASGAALLAATPAGALADRLGPRDLLIALIAADGVSMAAFIAVRSYWAFLAVAVLNTVAAQASTGVKTTYVAGLAAGSARVAELARQRSASHVGYTTGAAFGAVCLAAGTPAAFAVLIAVNAATSLACAGLLVRVPRVPGAAAMRPAAAARAGSAGRGRRPAVARDPAFMTVVAATGMLSLCWGLVSTGLPLWLARDTRLPVALAAVVVIVNSAGIALLQVTASRGCDTARRSARRAAWSGAALAAACLLLAATRQGAGLLGAGLVLVAALAHLAGELWFVAAKWGLTLNLTPAGATGQYQGAAASAQAGAQMLSPVAMTLLIGTWGQPGWLVLAGVFAATAAVIVPSARWAERTRPASPRPAPSPEVTMNA